MAFPGLYNGKHPSGYAQRGLRHLVLSLDMLQALEHQTQCSTATDDFSSAREGGHQHIELLCVTGAVGSWSSGWLLQVHRCSGQQRSLRDVSLGSTCMPSQTLPEPPTSTEHRDWAPADSWQASSLQHSHTVSRLPAHVKQGRLALEDLQQTQTL